MVWRHFTSSPLLPCLRVWKRAQIGAGGGVVGLGVVMREVLREELVLPEDEHWMVSRVASFPWLVPTMFVAKER
jgi:hypothetical protein